MVLTVLRLRTGDLVSDNAGTLGKVISFHLNGVSIDWEGESGARCHSDDDLMARRVVLVDGAR